MEGKNEKEMEIKMVRGKIEELEKIRCKLKIMLTDISLNISAFVFEMSILNTIIEMTSRRTNYPDFPSPFHFQYLKS